MKYPISIDYSQINIFNDGEPEFNLWNEQEGAQGFAWREKAISFGVPDHDDECFLIVEVIDEFLPLTDDVVVAIRVPFQCASIVHIVTITDNVNVELNAGHYNIEFRIVRNEDITNEAYQSYIYFYFKKSENRQAVILKKSDEMTSDEVLTMSARSAAIG